MPVASSIEADAADGNFDKWKVWIIIVGYNSMPTLLEMRKANMCGIVKVKYGTELQSLESAMPYNDIMLIWVNLYYP